MRTRQLMTNQSVACAAGMRGGRWVALAVVLLTTLGLSSGRAGSLDPSHVPADAQWLIHIDYEALSDSALCQTIRDEKPAVSKMVQGWMKQRYGIDPPQDLKSLTMFSRDYREYTGTVVIKADYDGKKVKQRLQQAMNHRTTQWQDHTLHTITLSEQKSADEGPSGDEEMTVVMVDEETLILASSVANAKRDLKLLAGKSTSLQGKKSPLLTDKVDSAWMHGAAINLGELKQHPVAMPIIAQHERITWSFGKQSDGKLYEQANLVAQSNQIAKKMKTILDGVVAYEELWAAESKPLSALIQNVEVTHEGQATGFHWQGSSDQVVDAMEDVFAMMESWKPILMKHKQEQGYQAQ